MEDNKDLKFDTSEESIKSVETKKKTRAAAVIPNEEVKSVAPVVTDDGMMSCLKNERIIVRHIPKESGLITDPKHVNYGGMAANAAVWYTVPILASTGNFVNVLTNGEKTFLEHIMGLEPNALSIYLKQNNFWENYSVRLIKGDNIFDLSDPDDYIKYKVLLANRDYIASSLSALNDRPKATYKFVVLSENEESKENNKQLTATMEAYMVFGSIQEDKEKLKFIVETLAGRPISKTSKLSFIKSEAGKFIQVNPKLFLQVAKDELLDVKVFIGKCIELGLINKRGNFLYLAVDNSPLCEVNEEPVLSVAAKYLMSPRHQEIRFTLEAKIKALEE